MEKWVDYSAARLSGGAIKAAGFKGAIRYVGTPGRGKNATPDEVRSIRAAGLGIHGVYENTTKDWSTGFGGGVAAAKAALADPAVKAMPANAVIFVCADMHLNQQQCGQFRSYVLGAKSILGKRCGAYGFEEAIDAVADLDIWFWQCGSQKYVRSCTHVYQWNNGNTHVAGVTCDINYIYRPLTGPIEEDELPNANEVADAVWNRFLGDAKKVWGNTQAGHGLQMMWSEMFGGSVGADDKHLAANSIPKRLERIEASVAAVQGALSKQEADLLAAVKNVEAGRVDVKALATALAPLLPEDSNPTEIGKAVASELASRLTAEKEAK